MPKNHPCRMITIGGSGYRKHQPGIDKRSLYSKDPIENRREKIGEEHFGDPKTFTEFSNNWKDVYLNIDECNQGEKSKIWNIYFITWWNKNIKVLMKGKI